MLSGAEIKSDSIILHCESADDLRAFEQHTGVDPHRYHLSESETGRESAPMQVSYHVPETGQPVQRASTGAVLGAPQKGETEYRIELRFPPQTGKALTSRFTPSKFFYEDIVHLARQLGKGRRDEQGQLIDSYDNGYTPLITKAQEQELLNLARSVPDLEAAHTLFFPDRETPRFMVKTVLGGMLIDFNETHSDYDPEAAMATYRAVYDTNVSNYADTETLQLATDELVAHGMLSDEETPHFMKEVRAMRLRQEAITNLQYAQTNVGIEHHTQSQLEGSRGYVEIMRALAETGDVSHLSPEDLLEMCNIGLGNSSVYDFVQIRGREPDFQRICENYLPEIETALATVQGVAGSDERQRVWSTSLGPRKGWVPGPTEQ